MRLPLLVILQYNYGPTDCFIARKVMGIVLVSPKNIRSHLNLSLIILGYRNSSLEIAACMIIAGSGAPGLGRLTSVSPLVAGGVLMTIDKGVGSSIPGYVLLF